MALLLGNGWCSANPTVHERATPFIYLVAAEGSAKLSTFLNWWFVVYFAIRQVAMFGQLYAFSLLQVGKTMALFSATSIVAVNALGILLLGEILSVQAYLAIALVVLGFVVLALSP